MSEAELLFEQQGALGLITLNRLKALNALTHAMCLDLARQLRLWDADPSVERIVIRGAGERAFCAGGDVVAARTLGLAGDPGYEAFFHDEYRLNFLTSRLAKPYIALVDGVVMGGGVGLAAHGPYRVGTERTLFAMPETAIGLIPDVGGTHLLSRMPGHVGRFLGLTGQRLGPGDALACGFLTHAIDSGARTALLADLAAPGVDVEAVLADYAFTPADSGTIKPHRGEIERLFAAQDLETLVRELHNGSPWTREQAAVLARLSPTSLALTWQALQRAATLDLAGCLTMEYRLVCALKTGPDFYEGVRAQLVDKDQSPRWSPAVLARVNGAAIAAAFETIPEGGDLDLSDL